MARAAGIEITETEVRVAELDGSDKKFRVLGATAIPIEPNEDGVRTPEQVGIAARQALKAVRAKREQIVLGLPAREATIREIVIPFTNREQIKKVIKFESESHLPSANIDDVIVGFYKISEQGPRSRVLIFAVEKATIKKHIEALGKVGIEPTQIDLGATGLFGLTQLIPDLAGDDPEDTTVNVVLDLGDVTTTVMVTQGKSLRMVRSMRLGTETLTRTLSADLGIDAREAKTVTQSIMRPDLPFGSGDPGREPTTALTATELKTDIIKDKEDEFARRIVSEVRRTLSSVHVDGRIAGIWLTGPASTGPSLERELKDTFGVPVRPLDVLSAGDHRLEPTDALFAGPSIGLGLKALEHDPVRLEFRQEEFSYARKFDRVRNPLLFASALVLVLFAFLSIIEYKAQQAIEKDIDWTAKQAANEYDIYVLGAARRFSKYVTHYENADEAEAAFLKLKRGESAAQIRNMIREIGLIKSGITENYGINFDGDSQPPEEIATSMLVRLEAWATVMNEVETKLKVRFKIDKLNVTDSSVGWTWRVPAVVQSDINDMLTERFKAMEDFKGYKSGTSKTQGEETEISAASVDFDKGYQAMALPKITNKKKSKNDEGDKTSKGPGGGLKAFVIMLIVMDLLAAGAYGYLTLVRKKEVTRNRNTARRNLLRVKEGGEEVSLALAELKRARSEKVADPKTPIIKAAQAMKIVEFLTVQNPSRVPFAGDSNWFEHRVNVQFREKRGYKFKDLVSFCKTIEAKNPKAQVSSLNFNKRDDTEESFWRPTSMVVRIFKPRDSGERQGFRRREFGG